MPQQVYFVGSQSEVAHHAAPLADQVQYQIVPVDGIVEKCQPGDLAIFYSEHFDHFRDAIRKLKSQNVATLCMIDGILEWRNAWENRVDEPACPFAMRPILSHKVACIGFSQARILQDWGNQGKVEIVGIPRFDCLVKSENAAKFENKDAEHRNRVLVMTAKCPAYTDQQQHLLLESLQDLKKFFDGRPDLEPFWRLTANLDRELGVENQLNELTGAELASQLKLVGAVITTPSTAALESMILDKPTAVLDYNACPSYFQAAWNINSRDHLAPVISELVDPTEIKMLFQRQCLSFELCQNGNASDRMADLIQQMLRFSSQVTDGEMRFPESMLPPVSPQLVNFDHASLYPQYSDFQNDDVTQLQTELAHSRREIKHLQNQLAQIQTELGQAHKIFDEINNHPIAGPVVKLRQKWFDLMRKLKIVKSARPEPNGLP